MVKFKHSVQCCIYATSLYHDRNCVITLSMFDKICIKKEGVGESKTVRKRARKEEAQR